MGLDDSRKEKLVPRYKPHEAQKPVESQTFNDAYLEHHNIYALKWRTEKQEKKDGDSDDG